MFTVPSSFGTAVREFNPCHAPDTGRFCSTPGSATKQSRPKPNPTIQREADAYNTARGLGSIAHPYVEVDQARAGRIADAYDALPADDRTNPAVAKAYAALASEVRAQWDHATAAGMRFLPWTRDGQPYETSVEMATDVQQNKRLYFYTGGEPHPLLGEKDPSTGLTVNDMFRAIHDYYGHAAGGYGFGPRGEENAWIVHSQMFSRDARRALTTETRGQNSWVNFGRQNYHPDGSYKNIPPKDRPFATQKVALLPDEFLQLPRLSETKKPEPVTRKPAPVREEDELPYPPPPPKVRQTREFNRCHDPKDGKFTFKGQGNCGPAIARRPRGSAGSQARVGITSARPDNQDVARIEEQMRTFSMQLRALPGVSHAQVSLGRGAWQGGSEPTWVVSYRGNGEARRLMAKTGQRYNQDAVLLVFGCKSAARCQPMVEWTFDSKVTGRRRDVVDQMLGEAGMKGWTWLQKKGRPVLRMVSVTQWGGSRQQHLADTQRITRAFRRAGLQFGKSITNVRTETFGNSESTSYDDVLRRVR